MIDTNQCLDIFRPRKTSLHRSLSSGFTPSSPLSSSFRINRFRREYRNPLWYMSFYSLSSTLESAGVEPALTGHGTLGRKALKVALARLQDHHTNTLFLVSRIEVLRLPLPQNGTVLQCVLEAAGVEPTASQSPNAGTTDRLRRSLFCNRFPLPCSLFHASGICGCFICITTVVFLTDSFNVADHAAFLVRDGMHASISPDGKFGKDGLEPPLLIL